MWICSSNTFYEGNTKYYIIILSEGTCKMPDLVMCGNLCSMSMPPEWTKRETCRFVATPMSSKGSIMEPDIVFSHSSNILFFFLLTRLSWMMKVDIYSSKKKKAKSVQDVYKTIKKKNTKQNRGLVNWRNGVFFVPRYKHHFGMTILLGGKKWADTDSGVFHPLPLVGK